jgi:hypothetical protein
MRQAALTTREQLQQLVDQVDEETADEVIKFIEWLQGQQAAALAGVTAPQRHGSTSLHRFSAPRPRCSPSGC